MLLRITEFLACLRGLRATLNLYVHARSRGIPACCCPILALMRRVVWHAD